MLPEKIGEYNILDSLGSGTFGDVYKVEKDDKLYALKHIVLGSKVDNVILQLEVDSHGSIPKHENIVGFVSYFKSWYRWNIVLEFCDLGTLDSYLVGRNPDKVTILSFMRDMACGLNHLHSNNIVHRDIKPENILLVQGTSDTPVCKISDFGVARFISEVPTELTRGEATEEKYFQSLRGTPFFVAPEVRKGQYTKSCDIFSLGIVYYLLFSRELGSDKRLMPYCRGGTPFYRATEDQIKKQVDLYVKDDLINHLLCSMMMTDLHCRISAAELEDELRAKCITYKRETRQNNVLNIITTIKEQLEKLEEEGYSALLMWHDVEDDGIPGLNPRFKSVGPCLPTGEINNFLDRFTGLVENKPDEEHLDSHSEASDYPEGLYPDELSTSSRMSTQSSPFEVETYTIAVNTPTFSTSTVACQTDPEPVALPPGPAGSLPSTITLSGLSGITLTCPASITVSSLAGITLSSAAGISVLGALPEGKVAESELMTSEEHLETSQAHGRSRVSSTSSVHTVDTTSSKSSQSRSSSVNRLHNIGRSSSFATGRRTSGAGRGAPLERSSSSASSKKPTSPVTRTRSSPAVAHPMSSTRTITSPRLVRKSSPSPSTHPSSPKTKTPASPTARKSSTSTSTSDTTHAAAHNHPQPVSVKSPTMKKKKEPSPAPNRKTSSATKSSHNPPNGHSQSRTSSQTSVKTSSHSAKPTSHSTSATSHSTKTTSHSNTATSHSSKPTPHTSSTPASHPPTKTPSPSTKKKSPPSPPPSPSPSRKKSQTSPPPSPTSSTTPKSTPKKEDESKSVSVFGRLFRWK